MVINFLTDLRRVDWSAEKQARITKLAGNLGNDTVLNRVAKAATPEQVGKITGVVDKKNSLKH